MQVSSPRISIDILESQEPLLGKPHTVSIIARVVGSVHGRTAIRHDAHESPRAPTEQASCLTRSTKETGKGRSSSMMMMASSARRSARTSAVELSPAAP